MKKVLNYSDINDFYTFGEIIGQGKYGLVKKAVNIKSATTVAVKIVQKQDLSLKENEMIRREIEVLKNC